MYQEKGENNWDERQVPKHIDVSKLEIHKYVKLSEIRLITLTLVDLGSSFKHKYTQWRWTFLVLKNKPENLKNLKELEIDMDN